MVPIVARLVSWHGWIDGRAPKIDSAGHALAAVDSLLPEPFRHLQAAHPVMTQDNQNGPVRQGFQVLKLARHCSHRNQLCVGDPRKRELIRLADVDQDHGIAGIETAFYF